MRHKFKIGDKIKHVGNEIGYAQELKGRVLTVSEIKESATMPGEPCYGFAEDPLYHGKAMWLDVDENFVLVEEWVEEWQ